MNVRNLFSTTKKRVITISCMVAALAVLGTTAAFAAGVIAEKSAIGTENAQNFAFADAGIDPLIAQNVRTEFDYEQRQFIYEVEFDANGTEYEYWIKASDGTVVKKQMELISAGSQGDAGAANLTAEDAKKKVLADAGLTEAEVTFTKVKSDCENGAVVYEIEFFTAFFKYEYEVIATTGAIYSIDKEALKQPDQGTTTEQTAQLSLDTAKEKALADAGMKAADVTFTKAKLDRDNGVLVYDIEFFTAAVQYDYEINAIDGAIHSKETKPYKQTISDNTAPNGNSAADPAYISVESAKISALADANISEATFTKAKLDRDDGVVVYEIEFYTATHEYDYEIDALTGAVRSRSAEILNKVGANGGNTGAYIGIDKAKSIALNHANLSAAQVVFSKAKLEDDDGITVYEIEFFQSKTEFEYTINAFTGEIVEYESDQD